MSSIRTVFTVGLALNAPVVLLMCLFDDAAVLADDDAAVPPELETLDEEAAPTGGAPPGPTGCWGALGRQHIPYILFCSLIFTRIIVQQAQELPQPPYVIYMPSRAQWPTVDTTLDSTIKVSFDSSPPNGSPSDPQPLPNRSPTSSHLENLYY